MSLQNFYQLLSVESTAPAEDIKKASQERLLEFDKKMREARRQADQQMSQIKNEALNEKSAIISGKRLETQTMLAQARSDIRNKTEEAWKKLESESQLFAYRIASQILKRPIEPKRPQAGVKS